VKKALKILVATKYLSQNDDGIHYNLQNQTRINLLYIKQTKENFFNSYIQIDSFCTEYFQKQSKEKCFYDYIVGNLITKLWFNVPVTHFEIEKTLGVKKHVVKRLKDIHAEPTKIKYNDSRYSAFTKTKFNIVTIGNKYTLLYDPIITKCNIFTHRNHFYIEKNLFDENKNLIIGKNKQEKITQFIEKISELKEHIDLRLCLKKYRYCMMVRSALSFFSDYKKEFITRLSENYLLWRMRNHNLVLQ
jgi:hypothetical protein